ncbi:MAG TPA: ATP-binding protein [Jatrophihabitans sp.]|nr:ATP-binding protein [Jatrophihabitans sp.]
MRDVLWGRRPPPPRGLGADLLGRWQLSSLADLSACRRRLTAALHGRVRPARADEGSVERIVLLFEELGSNALRHGRRPVQLTVWSCSDHWLLTVSDAAVESAPIPAINRDAAQGGMGLYLVARLGNGHGWTVDGDHKIAWVQVSFAGGDSAGDTPA